MSADGERLPRRVLASGLTTSAIGMGCSRLGAFWQGRSPAAGLDAIAAAREAGISFFDTADCYARGLSERLLGRALRTQRDDVVICTKVGLLKTPAAYLAARRAGSPARAGGCYEERYVTWAVERSLRRLQTDRVDLLLLHSPAARDLISAASWPALERLVEAGKVRAFGVSCEDATTARAAARLPGVSCLELPWSPDRPEVLESVVGDTRERGINVLVNRPFGDGELLQHAASSGRPYDEVVAERLQAALKLDGVDVVLVGMSRRSHVVANVAAATRPLSS